MQKKMVYKNRNKINTRAYLSLLVCFDVFAFQSDRFLAEGKYMVFEFGMMACMCLLYLETDAVDFSHSNKIRKWYGE